MDCSEWGFRDKALIYILQASVPRKESNDANNHQIAINSITTHTKGFCSNQIAPSTHLKRAHIPRDIFVTITLEIKGEFNKNIHVLSKGYSVNQSIAVIRFPLAPIYFRIKRELKVDVDTTDCSPLTDSLTSLLITYTAWSRVTPCTLLESPKTSQTALIK